MSPVLTRHLSGRMDVTLSLTSEGTVVPGRLERCIRAPSVEEANLLWKPLLEQAGEEDAHWPWERLPSDYRVGCRHFSVRADGVCQGLMIVREKEWTRGRDGGKLCCYIERVCTAPWNRSRVRDAVQCDRRRVTPVGRCLIAAAVQLSVEFGYQGRLAWHSLPRAVNDYERIFGEGLDNLGIDYEFDLPWLEVGGDAARGFLNQISPIMCKLGLKGG